MTDLVTILGLEGTFRVPRGALEAVDYFRTMLPHHSPLYLPFPKKVVRAILGVVLHGDNWTYDLTDPNIMTGLLYCGLMETPPGLERNYPLNQPIIIERGEEITSLSLPGTSLQSLSIQVNGSEVIKLDKVKTGELTNYFRVCGPHLILNPEYLARLNLNGIRRLLYITPWRNESLVQGEVRLTIQPAEPGEEVTASFDLVTGIQIHPDWEILALQFVLASRVELIYFRLDDGSLLVVSTHGDRITFSDNLVSFPGSNMEATAYFLEKLNQKCSGRRLNIHLYSEYGRDGPYPSNGILTYRTKEKKDRK